MKIGCYQRIAVYIDSSSCSCCCCCCISCSSSSSITYVVVYDYIKYISFWLIDIDANKFLINFYNISFWLNKFPNGNGWARTAEILFNLLVDNIHNSISYYYNIGSILN
jgi:hypothetical protein